VPPCERVTGSAFFSRRRFLARTSDFKSRTCAAVQALARKRVTCALGLNGQSLCLSLVHPAARKAAWPGDFRRETSIIDRQPVMRRPSARDAVGGSQDLFVVPSTAIVTHCSLSGSHFYYLRKLRSMPDRLGCLSFRSAPASICSQWLIEQRRSAAAEG
jgi:hypothetical protein